MNSKAKWALLSAAIVATTIAFAEDLVESGFMTDYTQLKKIEDGTADYRFVIEDWEERIAGYNAIMVDQPEIFLANDSPYRGAKPRHLVALAEAFREGLNTALSEGGWYVVNKPGPGVLYARVAISNLRLSKKKKSILGYTPIGLVGGAVVGAAQTDIAKKADLINAVLELEVMDSMTDTRIVAIIDHAGESRENASSWEELEDRALAYGMLASCRLNNPKLEPELRVNCFAEHLKRLETAGEQ